MPNITEETPAALSQLEHLKREAVGGFPSLWRGVLEGWSAPAGEDRLWLMYSANYLLRTGDLRWAIDPLRLSHRLPGAPEMDFAADLKPLSLVVLTHRHEDHLDLELLHSLSDLSIDWVVPEPILKLVEVSGIPASRIIVPRMLEPLAFPGLRLTPFEGLHLDRKGDVRHGVPSVGYLAEFGEKRWLFPGDTREYDAGKLPDLGEVDGLAAHVWLGRGCARMEEPPLLEAFIAFCLALRPKRVLLTHLNELGRDPSDLWELHHAERICKAFAWHAPTLPVSPAMMGDCVRL